jgi:hypothetical protein
MSVTELFHPTAGTGLMPCAIRYSSAVRMAASVEVRASADDGRTCSIPVRD